MPKRKCHFREEYSKEWTFIKKGRNDEEAYCSFCNSFISVSHGGRADLLDHLKTNKHKTSMQGATSSKPIIDFFVKKDSKEDVMVAAAELATAYHVVKHHHSFNSVDCSNKLHPTMYSDSKVATKQSTARTKATALINNVLSPHSVSTCVSELENIPFYGVSTDASNHKAEKIFPLLIQYFKEDCGITTKIIKVSSLKNETSETITSYCLTSLAEVNLPLDKCTSFCGDNTNTNFGGVNRKGVNNIFHKLQGSLGKDIEGIGCPAHVLHNTASCAADVLAVDVETIVVKLFNYFSIYTIRTEELKHFCEFVDITYKQLLYHTRTRWVSLMPAIERILKLWEALKSYFISQEKCPKILLDFFSNTLNEAYLWFLHNQMSLFHRHIKSVESSSISVIEVKSILGDTLKAIKEREESVFIGFKTKQIIAKEKESDKERFMAECTEFFQTAFAYLEKWSESLQHLSSFDWMMLKTIPEWSEVEETLSYFSTKNILFPESEVFDQFVCIKNIVAVLMEKHNAEEEEENQWGNINASERWMRCFKVMQKCQFSHLLKMCQYIFSIPAHNANVERVFSLMNTQWTDERNRLSVETIQNILICQYNYNQTCVEFYEYVKNNPELLKAAKSSEKYQWYKEK